MANQGRPGVSKYSMVMHVRELMWTKDGWPIVSPERYAGVEQYPVLKNEIAGQWQHIEFDYRVVPGYSEEQVSPDFQIATDINLNTNGTINNETSGTWNYNAPWLELKWSDGRVETVMVLRGLDWEQNADSCILFTGFDESGKTTFQ